MVTSTSRSSSSRPSLARMTAKKVMRSRLSSVGVVIGGVSRVGGAGRSRAYPAGSATEPNRPSISTVAFSLNVASWFEGRTLAPEDGHRAVQQRLQQLEGLEPLGGQLGERIPGDLAQVAVARRRRVQGAVGDGGRVHQLEPAEIRAVL